MRKRLAFLIAMLMLIASIPVYADSDVKDYIDISVNGTEYLKVTQSSESQCLTFSFQQAFSV